MRLAQGIMLLWWRINKDKIVVIARRHDEAISFAEQIASPDEKSGSQ